MPAIGGPSNSPPIVRLRLARREDGRDELQRLLTGVYWRFDRDQFFELVPAPGARTLDLGCGEGRVARGLAALGHVVTGSTRRRR